MRKHLCLLSVAGLLAACQSEELAEATRGDVQRVRMEVADYVWADETRTSAELSGNSVQFKWTAGDVIGIFGEVGDQVSFPISKGFDSPTAEFDGGVWALRSGCKYVAYHPYSYDNRDRTAIPVSYEGQKQTGNGTVAHLTERDVLVSELTAPTSGEVTFHFGHLGGVARVKLTVPDADTYTKFTLSASTAVFPVEQTLNLITNGLSDKTLSDHIDLTLSGISTTSANEVVTLYLLLPPVDLAGTELTATLSGAKSDYTATVTGKTLACGGAVAYTATVEKPASSGGLVDNGDYTGTLDGHEWVDLGIRKSDYDTSVTPGSAQDRRVVFATCNIGADNPEDYGYYFRWGELQGWKVTTASDGETITSARQYDKDGTATSLICSSSTFSYLGWALDAQSSAVDFQGQTDLTCNGQRYGDAATYNWGGEWKMMNNALLQKLTFKSVPSTFTVGSATLSLIWTSRNGVNGIELRNTSTGVSLFLPATGSCYEGSRGKAASYGNYWISTPTGSNSGYGLCVDSDYFGWTFGYCSHGFSVRPLSELPL